MQQYTYRSNSASCPAEPDQPASRQGHVSEVAGTLLALIVSLIMIILGIASLWMELDATISKVCAEVGISVDFKSRPLVVVPISPSSLVHSYDPLPDQAIPHQATPNAIQFECIA